jgi:uncharacterized protein YehS (DUF1456 family)
MDNNDILRRLRFTFDFGDDTMIRMFALGGYEVTRADVSDWLKREEDEAFDPIDDRMLAVFLNGLISDKRGPQGDEFPEPEEFLNNNMILRKLKIALELKSDDILAMFASVDRPISPHELTAFMRNPKQHKYRPCNDQYLRNFLNGLQKKYKK